VAQNDLPSLGISEKSISESRRARRRLKSAAPLEREREVVCRVLPFVFLPGVRLRNVCSRNPQGLKPCFLLCARYAALKRRSFTVVLAARSSAESKSHGVESCGIPLLAKCARNGAPGKCNVKGSGRGRPLYFKIKVKSNGQECRFHTSSGGDR
jgi:hypothetical protein